MMNLCVSNQANIFLKHVSLSEKYSNYIFVVPLFSNKNVLLCTILFLFAVKKNYRDEWL